MEVIKAGVTSDPFAPNYGIELREFEYHEGWTLRRYVVANFDHPEMVEVYVNLLKPESLDVIVTPDDGLLIVSDLGYGVDVAAVLGYIATTIKGALVAVGVSGTVAGAVGWAVAIGVYAGGMLLVNSLLAPDKPNIGHASGADTSKAHQWGAITNSAQEMITKPVGLGTFSVRGNLVASRTESFNVEKAGYSIQETLYLLYSCVNNKIATLNSVTINGMDASTFADDDISIFYTDGSNAQAALTTDSTSFLTADPIAPASSGPLFPALSVETLLNTELVAPDHIVDYVESGSVFVGYSHQENPDHPLLTASLRVAVVKTDSTIYAYYKTDSGVAVGDFTGFTTPCYVALTVTDLGNYLTTTEWILVSNIVDGGVTGDYQYLTLTVSGTRELPQAWSIADLVYFSPAISRSEKTYTVTLSGTDVWDQYHYLADASWTAYTSTLSAIEDLEMQFVLPRGLYLAYGGSHSGHAAGAKLPRWETYAFHVLQLDASTSEVEKDILFTPPDDGSSLSIIAAYKTASPGMPRAFMTYGSYSHAHTFSIKATDIVAAYADFPALFTTPSGTQLALDGDGYLPTGHKYQIKLRIHGHGAEGRKGGMFYSTIGPNDPGGSTDNYETRLYRIKELDYGEVLRYPNQALLAIVMNSTPVSGGQMPVVVANYDYTVNYWDGTDWTEGHTKNPAQLATGFCYSSLWGAGIGGASDSEDEDVVTAKQVAIAEAVDLVKFAAFAVFCADTAVTTDDLAGEPNYIYNGLLDSQRPFWDVLTEVCAVANGRPYFDGPKISVYWEEDQTTVIQVFNSATMKEGSFSESYVNTVDSAEAINGSFIDEDTDEKTAITWIHPSGDPLKTVSVELSGVTNRHRALRAIQYKLNKTDTIKKSCKFETWTSALNCGVGDLIVVENEFVRWGTEDAGGFVTAVDSVNKKVTLDRLFTEPTGTKFLMLRARATDTIATWTVASWDNTGTTTILTLTADTGLSSHAAKDSFIFGVGVDAFGQYIASTVDVHGDFSVSIEALQYIEQSSLDSGMFTITAASVPGITKENFCPRNITLTADLAETEVEIAWLPPLAVGAVGTGSGYLTDYGSEYAIGTNALHIDTGTGTILVGDKITFAGDLNEYTITTGFAGDGDADIVIAGSGLIQTLANNVAMAISSNEDMESIGVLKYQVWRRRGSSGSFELVTETEASPYTDKGLSPGSHYFYKVLSVFDYNGSPAVIPLSWCSNFTGSGNADVDSGVDFSWSVYEYLPLPALSTHADHSDGYLVTENAVNDTLCDITVFLTDPDNWRYRDSSEGYSFWVRTNDSDDVLTWFGPTGITLGADCLAGASTITVSSVSGLTIPGLIVIDDKDLVYVHSAVTTTLTLGHPSYFDADDLTRKFTIGVAHSSGVSVYNAHKGFFPVRYFGFEEEVEVITDARQLTCDSIYRFNIATDAIVGSSSFAGMVQVGIDKFRPVYSKDNIVGKIELVTSDSFVSAGLLVPPSGDFTINLAYQDISGRPNGVYTAVWAPTIEWAGEIKRDKNGDLYFTIQGLPQISNCWFAINRIVWDAPVGFDTYGWTSHIKPMGI